MIGTRRRIALLVAAGALFAGALAAAASAGTQLEIRRISPSGTNVPPAQQIVFQFNRVMVPLGNLARRPAAVPITISPTLACEWRWLDTTELACRLPGNQTFRPATRYRITVGTALTALDGARLPKPVEAEFTTQLPGVAWANFQAWRAPTVPTYLLQFNVPVTAGSVERTLYFDDGDKGSAAVRAEPFDTERSGPLWLPVPGTPGAMVVVENPNPRTPLDADKAPGEARIQWLVIPASPLAPARDYRLKLRPGLRTPLGELPGTGGMPWPLRSRTFGPFAFSGVSCDTGNESPDLLIAPHEAQATPCEPGHVALAFSAPVPRSTLAAARWLPAPLAPTRLAAAWQGYSPWHFGVPHVPTAADQPEVYPLPFDLAPMSRYTITVPAGVEDGFGRRLEQADSVTVVTGHRAPSIDLPPADAVLEAHEPTVVTLGFTNLRRIDLDYRRLLADAFRNPVHPAAPASAGTVSILRRAGAAAKPDAVVTTSLGIREALEGQSGALWGRLDWAPRHDAYAHGRKIFAEVTPWETFAKVGHFNTLVWVSSFATGAPVANARVALYSESPDQPGRLTQVGTAATTDEGGVATLPGSVQFGPDWFTPWRNDSLHYYVGVLRGDDMALLPLDDAYQRWIGDASNYALFSYTKPANGHIRAWAVTEQGIYRPGSDVRFAVFARDQSNARLVPPPALGYKLTITDPRGNEVLEQDPVRLSEFGGTRGSLHIPETAPTGWYRIDLAWPTATGETTAEAGRFLVTEFVPATFKVDTLLDGDRFGPGDTVAGSASARLHAGGPYTEAAVKFTATVVAEDFAPAAPAAAGFSFGGNPDTAPDQVAIAQTRGKLDDKGNADFAFKLPQDDSIVYGRLVLESAVESARGTWVAGRSSALYSARDRFVGLRMDQWLLQAGKAATVQFFVVDPNGNAAAGSPVHLRLEHQQVETARVKDASGYFASRQTTRWVAESECSATSTTAPGRCSLTPRHAGIYRVIATVTDTRGRRQTSTLDAWAVGPGQVPWQQGARVTLVTDKREYHVGDTARVLVQNPFPVSIALVTVERYGVLWQETTRLASGTPVIEIPVRKDFFPGAYLSVALFSPRAASPGPADLGKPELALGYVALPVVGKGGSLDVEVTPDAAVHKPRQRVTVRVQVRTGAHRAPGRTRLVAAVVDQAVLDLLDAGPRYYDPRATFYAPPQGPDMANYSLAEQLVTRIAPKRGKGESPGGGGGRGPSIRTIFKYSTYWNASLTTDAAGRANFSFKLPDNLTRWRIFVIALTPGAAMGLGDASVRVNLPIQLEPALPNQVHAGDRFGAGFAVTNRTPRTHKVVTRIEASGPVAGSAGHSSTTLELAAYARGLAWLDLAAEKPGTVEITATASAGTLGDAMQAKVPVHWAETPITAASYGSTTGAGASVPLRVPADAVPGSVHIGVTLAPTLLANLSGSFAAMRDDPLQIWEVRLSRAVLASDYLQLKPVLSDSLAWPDAGTGIDATLAAAADYQAPDGGMAYWIPRDEFVSPYLSVYTALAFDWLNQAGHPPPASVEAALRRYLRSKILAASPRPDGTAATAAPILRAGALAALAPTGSLPSGAAAGMLADLPRLDLFGQALLLEAAIETGDWDSAATIARALLSRAEESAGSISFNETESDAYLSILATPVRSNCAVLDALAAYARTPTGRKLAGATPEKLVRWITARRSSEGAWLNSQEDVFCATALAHYAEAYERPVADLVAAVSVAGKPAGNARFDSRKSAARTVVLSTPATATSAPVAVTVARSGRGRLYYGVRLSYAVPANAVGPADAGFTVHRAYYVQRGNEWRRVGPETVLARGDVVRVDLDVDTPTARHYVVLSDPLPGAFEAVNRDLATSAESLPTAEAGTAVLYFDYGPWPDSSFTTGGFYHRETAFDAVRFYADELPAGRYRLVYSAQVISPGTFVAPAPTVKEIYQPDVFGRGTSASVKVALPGN